MFTRKKKKSASEDAKAHSPRQHPKSQRVKESLLSLESRLMFDAAAAATAAEVNQEQVAQEQAEVAVSAEGGGSEPTATETESQEVLQAISTFMPAESRHEVAFVDPTVPNYGELLNGMDPNIEVIMLDGEQDGVEQMAAALSGRTGIDAIHVISHGDAGTLQLGTGTLNVDSMSGQYADELATIQRALSEQADILVYGCDFAEGDVGHVAANQLAALTGADVQASNDLTGNTSLGGDWDLEVKTGSIETRIAIDVRVQADWMGLLAAPTLDASKSPTLNSIAEDAGAPSGQVGTLVSSLVDFANPSGQVDNVTDTDSGAQLGIAITAANTTNGAWWYSTNNGSTWNALGAVSEGSARLLVADANTRIYFQGNADYNGTMSDAITFRAWDQTSGTAGSTADLTGAANTVKDQFSAQSYSNNNGTANWSGNWVEADSSGGGASGGIIRISGGELDIRANVVNDGIYRQANLSNATSATLSFSYNNGLGSGDQIAVQVSSDGGANYTTLSGGVFSNTAHTGSGTISFDITSAISANTQVRFLVTAENANNHLYVDNVQISYTTSATGGTTAFSTATDTASLVVTAVNDAPTITSLSGDSLAYAEGDGAVVIEQGSNALVADVDSTNFDTGTLTVRFTAGSDSAEDVLSIRNQGTSAGQIGVSGSTITYGGTTIGTFTGGSSGSNLVISLNSSATPTAVTTLVKNITYENTDINAPTTGARTVRFVLTDENGGTSANYDTTVTVSGVNDAPTDLALSANTVAENATTGTVVGTITGTDPDSGDTKTYSLTDTAGGRFAINSSTGQITVANGSLLNYESATSHSVTVRVTDSGGLTYDETLTINLTNVNEAPTGADATVTINEDTSHTLTTADFGFSDVDAGDSLSAVRIDTIPTAGTLTLSGVAVTAGQVVSVANITAGNLVFTPAADANGTGYANFIFSVRDSNNAYDTAPNSLIVDVTAVNDAPIRTAGTVNNLTVSEDAGLASLGLGGVTYSPGGGADESGQTLTYAVTAIPSASVGDVFLADGTTRVIVGSYTLADIQGMQFKPAANASGVTAFQFNVYDTGGTANGGGNTISQFILITVTAVNDAPVVDLNAAGAGQDVTTAFTEQTPVLIAPVGMLTDVDSANLSSLTVTLTARPDGDAVESLSLNATATTAASGAGLTVSYTASTGVLSITGSATKAVYQSILQGIQYNDTSDAPTTSNRTITMVANDGTTASTTQTVTVTVTAVNDPTVVTGGTSGTGTEDTTVTGTLTATDADGLSDGTVFTVTTNATNGTASIDPATGLWSYSPNPDYNGADSFTVTLTDDAGNSSTQVITLTVTPVADITNDSLTTAEDTAISANVLTGTNGATADSFEGTPVLTSVTQGANGSVTFLANGTVTYTPTANFTGTDSFTYTVTSGGVPETATVTVTVTAVNDPTVVRANTGSTVAEGGTDTIDSSELAVMDVDNTAVQLTYTIGTGPSYGRLELTTVPGVVATTFTQADIVANRLVYLHDGSETTSDSFTFTVNDGAGGSIGTTTVTLTITPVNDAPTIMSNGGGATVAINVAENVDAVTIVTGADVDLPAQALTYSISGGSDQALFTIDATTGDLCFVVPPDFEVATDANGDNVYIVQVRVTDSQGATATQTIQVTVTDVAEASAPQTNALTLVPALLQTSPRESEKCSQPGAVEQRAPQTNLITAPQTEQPTKPAETVVHPSGPMMPPGTPVEAPIFIKHEDIRRHETNKIEPAMPRWEDSGASSPFTIIPVEPEQPIDSKPQKEESSISDVLMTKLDAMTKSLEEAIGVEQEQEMVVTRVAALSGTTLSVGFVAWAVRSSALLASCLTTLPAWKNFDPLPVVRLSKQERNRRRQVADAVQRQEQDEFDGLQKFF